MIPNNPPKFVVDTNIVVSAVLFPKSVPRQALDHAQNIGIVVVSASTLSELQQVLSRSKFDRYVPLDERESFLQRLTNTTQLIQVTESVEACRDPKDNQYLELAVSSQASAIITGDRDLLVLHPFRDIAIVTPQVFLDSLFITNLNRPF
jgi:uncharacterized protein